MSRQLWEHEARQGKKEETRGKYLSGLFIEAVDRGLRRLETGRGAPRILKTDLWNEGADFEKNVLGSYAGTQYRLYGVDIAGSVLRQVKVREVRRAQADISRMPFQSAAFDAVLDLSTIDHVPHDRAGTVVSEYRRILHAGGILVMAVDTWGIFWRAYYAYQRRVRGMEVGVFPGTRVPNQYLYRPCWMMQLLRSHGFEILEEYSLDWFGWSWNRLTLGFWQWMMRRYRCLIGMEFSRFSKYMKPFAKQYVIIARTIR